MWPTGCRVPGRGAASHWSCLVFSPASSPRRAAPWQRCALQLQPQPQPRSLEHPVPFPGSHRLPTAASTSSGRPYLYRHRKNPPLRTAAVLLHDTEQACAPTGQGRCTRVAPMGTRVGPAKSRHICVSLQETAGTGHPVPTVSPELAARSRHRSPPRENQGRSPRSPPPQRPGPVPPRGTAPCAPGGRGDRAAAGQAPPLPEQMRSGRGGGCLPPVTATERGGTGSPGCCPGRLGTALCLQPRG